MMFSKEEFYPSEYGLPVPKGAPYVEAFDKWKAISTKTLMLSTFFRCLSFRIQVILETGLFKHWIRTATERYKGILSRSKKTPKQLKTDRLVREYECITDSKFNQRPFPRSR